MATRETKVITCDRCGTEVELGLGGTYLPHWLKLAEYGDLCPTCAKKFREFATEFFDDTCPKRWDISVHCINC